MYKEQHKWQESLAEIIRREVGKTAGNAVATAQENKPEVAMLQER